MIGLQIFLMIIVILLILGGMYYFLQQGRGSGSKKHNIEVIQGHMNISSSGKSSKDMEQDEQNKRRAEIARKLKDSQKSEEQLKDGKTTVAMMLEQAAWSMNAKKFWMFSAVSMCVLVFLAVVSGKSIFVIAMAAVIGLLGLPRFILKRAISKRQKKFLIEFPDALEATVRLLKAGMPVSESILMISREYSGPVGEEMSRIYEKQKIGIPLQEAALEATKRMPLTEMQMFATGLAIQAQTGSSLSEVLLNLSSVIRSRFRLKRKVKALSSEAVSSACIIGALPVLVAGGIYMSNPDHIMILFETKTGNIMLAGAAFWMTMGIVVMKVMINFKI